MSSGKSRYDRDPWSTEVDDAGDTLGTWLSLAKPELAATWRRPAALVLAGHAVEHCGGDDAAIPAAAVYVRPVLEKLGLIDEREVEPVVDDTAKCRTLVNLEKAQEAYARRMQQNRLENCERLYQLYATIANRQGLARLTAPQAAERLHTSPRSIVRWRSDLIAAGRLVPVDRGTGQDPDLMRVVPGVVEEAS